MAGKRRLKDSTAIGPHEFGTKCVFCSRDYDGLQLNQTRRSFAGLIQANFSAVSFLPVSLISVDAPCCFQTSETSSPHSLPLGGRGSKQNEAMGKRDHPRKMEPL